MQLPISLNKKYRIALAGIYHESNSFAKKSTALIDFKKGRWLKGQAIIDHYSDTHHELGGAIEVFRQANVEIVPVLYAEATPGGIITADCFRQLCIELQAGFQNQPALDACFIVPHGAAIAEGCEDMDGTWIEMLRTWVGPSMPIVGTLDPHANVSDDMIRHTQAMFPYRTNPHTDQRATGARAAGFLLWLLSQQATSIQQIYRPSLCIPIELQETNKVPCKSLLNLLSELSNPKKQQFAELILGFPYGDVKKMGSSIIAIEPEISEWSRNLYEKIDTYFREHYVQFELGSSLPISELKSNLIKAPKPVLLLDMGDNVGGGSMGDSTYLLEELNNFPGRKVICLYDPLAAKKLADQPSDTINDIPAGENPANGIPFNLSGKRTGVFNGEFSEDRAIHGGQKKFDMGLTIVMENETGFTILLHSKRMAPFSANQICSCNINLHEFDIIIAKGVIAPIAAYSPYCKSVFKVNSPGETTVNLKELKYNHRSQPLFPFENHYIQ